MDNEVKRKRGRPPKQKANAEAQAPSLEVTKDSPLSGCHGLKFPPLPTQNERTK